MAGYQIYYRTPEGDLLEIIQEFTRLEWARKENEVGAMTLTMPRLIDKSALRADSRLEIWRTSGGRTSLVGKTVWFLQDWALSGSYMELMAYDANWILSGAIVAYASGTTNAGCTSAAADDVSKAVVRGNLTTDATSDRDISAWLSVDPDLTLAQESTKDYSRRQVLPLLQELAQESREKGTYLAFDIEYVDSDSLIFKTFTGARGTNHGTTSVNPVILSEKFKSLEDVTYTERHGREYTYVYAGGQGKGDLRLVEGAEDTTRSRRSPFGRREGWVDARMCSTSDSLVAEACAALEAARPVKMITGKIVETEGCQFMVHYDFGDIVVAQFEDLSVDAHVDAVHGVVENGLETLDNRILGYL